MHCMLENFIGTSYLLSFNIYIYIKSRGNHFRFGLVFIKKNNQTEFFFKKTETGSNRLVSVLFGFLDKNRFKPV